jgi:plastocyanin
MGSWRGTRVGALLGIASLALAACGSTGNSVLSAPAGSAPAQSTAQTPSARPSPPYAQIKGSVVTPATLQVSTGETIEIKNLDAYSHNLEDKTHHLYNGDVPAKGTEELTAPANPGTYVFTDRGHSSVRLTLQVS